MSSPLRVSPTTRTTPVDGRDRQLLAAQQRSWLLPVLAGGVLALLLLLVISFRLGGREVKPLRQEVASLQAEVESLHAQQPTCDSYSDQIQELRKLVNQGQFSLVGSMVQLYLNDHERPACPAAKRALASIAYDAALNNLFLTPELDDHTALLRWQEAERSADLHELPPADRWPPMSVVSQAYNAGYWELARAAFLKAWDAGAVDGQHSLQQVQLYYAIQRNLGKRLVARGGTQEARRVGLTMLRTADAISRTWGLSRGEAFQDLIELLGSKVSRWPAPDPTDPVLAAGRGRS